jgi:hypothetical protein
MGHAERVRERRAVTRLNDYVEAASPIRCLYYTPSRLILKPNGSNRNFTRTPDVYIRVSGILPPAMLCAPRRSHKS